LSRKTSHISILQFDERLISRLQAIRTAKGIEVLGFDQEHGEWSIHDGTLESALKAFAAGHELAEDTVYTVLPRHDMTARILNLPSQDPVELAGMVRLSAEEYVPFPAEELVTDQCVLQKTPDGGSKVLAVFAHRDVVETHVKLLHAARIEPAQIYLSTACLASAVLAARGAVDQRYAVANLASGGLEVIVINGTRLEYGRAVASQQDWGRKGEGAGEVVEELGVELRASLSAYRRESEEGEEVGAIYLCSETADVAGPCEALFHELGQVCAPAVFARDLVSRGADLLPTLPLVALGAALIAQERAPIVIKLLPGSLVRSRERAGIKQQALRFGSLAAAIMIALIGLYAQAVHQRNAYVRDLNARIAQVAPRANGIVSKKKQLRILQRQVERSGGVIELLAALCDLFPTNGMNITRFQFTHNDKIEIWGRAKTLGEVEKLTQDMSEAGKTTLPQFARAQQVYEQKVAERGQEVLDFKITVPFPETQVKPSEEESSE
jgi:type II secretory pathway component PulL